MGPAGVRAWRGGATDFPPPPIDRSYSEESNSHSRDNQEVLRDKIHATFKTDCLFK